mgnify:FL=1|jgi:hypothetical protein
MTKVITLPAHNSDKASKIEPCLRRFCSVIALTKKSEPNYSGIYFIFFKEFPQFLKIGCSSDINKRLSNYITHTPFEVCIPLFFPVNSRYKLNEIESEFHNRLYRYRHSGEWYHFVGEVKTLVERLCIATSFQPQMLCRNRTFIQVH